MKEYSLKTHQLSRYAPMMVSSMKTKMRKFSSSLYGDFVLEYKAMLLNNDIDISWILVHFKQVNNENK